jgi:hypothetical protein
MHVITLLGAIAFTRIVGANSFASDFVVVISPPFADVRPLNNYVFYNGFSSEDRF